MYSATTRCSAGRQAPGCGRGTRDAASRKKRSLSRVRVRNTSVSGPRTVRVTGTATISPSCSITSSRVRSRIGRRLSGGRNAYQRISPRFIEESVPTLAIPRERVIDVRELTGVHGRASVTLAIVSPSQDDHLDEFALSSVDTRDGNDSTFADLGDDAVRLHALHNDTADRAEERRQREPHRSQAVCASASRSIAFAARPDDAAGDHGSAMARNPRGRIRITNHPSGQTFWAKPSGLSPAFCPLTGRCHADLKSRDVA
jgi:hypothetical protein